MLIEDLVRGASEIMPVSIDSSEQYRNAKDKLVSFVDKEIAALPEIHQLLGPNPLALLFDNHRNHVDFMSTVFRISNHEILARTVPWVYHAYTSRGVSATYFPTALRTWKRAIQTHLPAAASEDIHRIYDWMLSHHEAFVECALHSAPTRADDPQIWNTVKRQVLESLLEGDKARCSNLLQEALAEGHSLDELYVHVVQAAMTEIGRRWENGTISVAQEHLAAAIVGQVLASMDTPVPERLSMVGKAVVTAAPNEFHELGAWMINDLLDAANWDVRYFGADTNTSRLLTFLHSFEPDLLAISVTMPFNIPNATEIVKAVRGDASLKTVPDIVVGGRAFETVDHLWKTTGADRYFADAHSFRQYLNEAT